MHTDVTTQYLGLRLRSPLVVGACPMTLKPETVRELTIAGVGAVVLPSLLTDPDCRRIAEQCNPSNGTAQPANGNGDAKREYDYGAGVDVYLRTISLLKRHTGIPIIANLSGNASGEWLEYVRQIEASGADAIELFLQTDTSNPSLDAGAVEKPLLNAVEKVCDAVSIPISIKLLPFFTSLPNLAWRLAEAGAAGAVLFGREPIWEMCNGELVATSNWSLSDYGQLQTTLSGLIRLRNSGPTMSIAASGGITTAKDVVRTVIAGADVAMVTSEVYRTGPDAIAHILEGIIHYLQREGLDSFEEFVARSKATMAATPERQSQLVPMIHPDAYRDPRPEPSRRTGDRWGHSYKSQLDQ